MVTHCCLSPPVRPHRTTASHNRIADGYPSYPLSGLLDAIKSVVEDQNKTPLLIDNSQEENVTAFLSYKARTGISQYGSSVNV